MVARAKWYNERSKSHLGRYTEAGDKAFKLLMRRVFPHTGRTGKGLVWKRRWSGSLDSAAQLIHLYGNVSWRQAVVGIVQSQRERARQLCDFEPGLRHFITRLCAHSWASSKSRDAVIVLFGVCSQSITAPQSPALIKKLNKKKEKITFSLRLPCTKALKNRSW